jgi:hypothetical protein
MLPLGWYAYVTMIAYAVGLGTGALHYLLRKNPLEVVFVGIAVTVVGSVVVSIGVGPLTWLGALGLYTGYAGIGHMVTGFVALFFRILHFGAKNVILMLVR